MHGDLVSLAWDTRRGIRGIPPRIAEPARQNGNGNQHSEVRKALDSIEYSLLGGWFDKARTKIKAFCADEEVRRVFLNEKKGRDLAHLIIALADKNDEESALEEVKPLLALVLKHSQGDVLLSRLRTSILNSGLRTAIAEVMLEEKAWDALNHILMDKGYRLSLRKYIVDAMVEEKAWDALRQLSLDKEYLRLLRKYMQRRLQTV
ncbi:MAG: hypothetical protein V1728_03565 [Candidatus Micrarchaeota archaeon]